jgi:hypothetical protein
VKSMTSHCKNTHSHTHAHMCTHTLTSKQSPTATGHRLLRGGLLGAEFQIQTPSWTDPVTPLLGRTVSDCRELASSGEQGLSITSLFLSHQRRWEGGRWSVDGQRCGCFHVWGLGDFC